MPFARSLLAAALLLSAGCTAADKAPTEQQAKAVADAYFRKTFPSGKPDAMRTTALDMQDRWRFSYGGGTGGVIIVVNKHSGEVVHSEAQQ